MEYLSSELKDKFKKEMKVASTWKEDKIAASKEAKKMAKLTALEDKKTAHEANKGEIAELLTTLRKSKEERITDKATLYKVAKKANPLVTKEDVDKFWMGEDISQIKDMKGYNSWVGDLPREQYQVDIAYITKAKKEGDVTDKGGFLPEDEADVDEEVTAPKAKAKAKAKVAPAPPKAKKRGIKDIPDVWGSKSKAFICVDVFSKKVYVKPVEGTTAKDATEGMKEAVTVMGPPKEVYTDDGGEFKAEFEKYLKGQDIQHIITRRHAMFAERFTRYLRWHLRDMQKQHNEDWVSLLPYVLKAYNKGTTSRPVHSTTKVTPDEAHDDKNALEVKLGIVMAAKRDRKYPPMSVGDKVKIYQKKSRGEEKNEIVPVWSTTVFTIKDITMDNDHEYYELNPQPVGLKKMWLRHELLKVG